MVLDSELARGIRSNSFWKVGPVVASMKHQQQVASNVHKLSQCRDGRRKGPGQGVALKVQRSASG